MEPDQPNPTSPASPLDRETRGDAVSRVYAQSLFELAESQGQLDAIAEEVADLRRLIGEQDELRRLLTNPILDRGQRTGMVQRLFEGNVSDLLYRFIGVVNAKDRLAALPSIAAEFARLVSEHRGEVTVDAFVARPMDEPTRSRVAESLGQSLGKTVTLREHVDESLIGGLKLRIGDRMIDASVASQLRRMEEQLVAAGREKARTLAHSSTD